MGLVCILGNLFFLAILLRIVLSWFPVDPDGPVGGVLRVTTVVTEPVLGPVRRALPMVRMGAMGLDLSPILVIFGLRFVLRLVGC